MAEEAGKKANKGMQYAYAMLFTLLLGSSLINFFLIFGINSGLSLAQGDPITSEPAKLSITLIKAAGCDKCFSTDEIVSALKASGAEITEKTLEFGSTEADALIEKYSIERLPALVVYGEIESANVSSALGSNSEFDKNTLVLRDVKPPYVDLESNSTIGLVSITTISDSNCEKCASISGLQNELEQLGVGIGDSEELDANSENAQKLIAGYGIDRLPVAIVSKDLNAYPEITKQWTNVGRPAYNGGYIADYAVPYLDIESKSTIGLVNLTKLVDANCSDCYDVNIHNSVLARFGVVVGTEVNYDISSADGNALLQKYAIKKIPTIILSSDANAYSTLNQVWADVGTIEADGAYVFRDLNALGEDIKFRTLD